MAMDKLVVKGAREHNLKNVDVTIPRDKLVGQRRYVESLSSYARQFLGQMEKPDVDYIEGLSPAISIDQKTTSKNPRSTVGTVTEIYDYLRLLYARIGVPHCPVCGREIKQQTVDQIIDKLCSFPERTKIQILAPVVRGRKGEHVKEFENARKSGFVRVRADGILYDLSEEIKLEKNKKHNIEIVVDRLMVNDTVRSRMTDSVETALRLSGGLVIADVNGEDILFSQNYACPEHGVSIGELEPRMFSFNNPLGACPTCTGLGTFMKVDPDMVVPNKSLSIRGGAVKASGWYFGESGTIAQMYYEALAKHYGFSLDTPFKELTAKQRDIILYGTQGERIQMVRKNEYGSGTYETEFEGVVNNLERRFRETQSAYIRDEITQVMSAVPCPDCKGERLKKEYLAVTVGGVNISDFCKMSVNEALDFMENLTLSERDAMIAAQILKEVKARLGFLKSVGLEYLTLSRASATLSGGESQRIRLATIGLHQRDNDKLLATLQRLRDIGNTLIVVEHDEDTMRAADFIVDVGPGAGVHGGEIVCAGTPAEVMACENSITGQYLSGKRKIPVPAERRPGNGSFLTIKKAKENNLKGVTVKIPLGTFTCVSGVSGSGKSSLVNEVLFKTLSAELNGSRVKPGQCGGIDGLEFLDKVIDIDQSPIGRTPRSNPATYTGVFTDIRELFAQTADAKMRGYNSGRFSFNVKGGRCEACEGDGILKIEMHFLPDIFVPCEVCKGKRYNRETLEVKYKGKNIYDVLDMTVEEAMTFFDSIPRIKRKIETLYEVGLGYIKMGQPATTLSGGEAQRVKLATELSKRSTGKTIYILDEPTTGLHSYDVQKLIEVLQKLVDAGNTVVVIEHNLDVLKTADWIIDLGPEGGDRGGTIVGTGTPEQLAKIPESYTGKYLAPMLEQK